MKCKPGLLQIHLLNSQSNIHQSYRWLLRGKSPLPHAWLEGRERGRRKKTIFELIQSPLKLLCKEVLVIYHSLEFSHIFVGYIPPPD